MPWLDPEERVQLTTRVPYPPNRALIVVVGASMLVGPFLVAVGLGWLKVDGLGGRNLWLLALFGAAMLMAGALVAMRSVETVVLRRRTAGAVEAWRRDYPWPRVPMFEDDRVRTLVLDAMGFAIVVLMFVLLNAGLRSAGDVVPSEAWWILAILDVLFVLGLLTLGRHWWLRSRGPRVRVTLDRTPIEPGESLRGRLRIPAAGAGPSLSVELRGIREWVEWRSGGDGRRPWIRSHVFYRETLPERSAIAGELTLEIPIPPDAPSTRLAEAPVTYWELVTRPADPRVSWESVVLLPVYASATPGQPVPTAGSPST